MDKQVVESLRLRYPGIHPLMFHRSAERARTVGDLFDILDSVPSKFPLIWDEDSHRWTTCADLFQSKRN